MAIISHIGRNTDHGHYVCHIKKDNHWAFFNDEKVAPSPAMSFLILILNYLPPIHYCIE